MLAELFAWLTTPCLAEARKLGYLKEAIALRHRARRCAGLWAPHLRQSAASLLESLPESGGRGMVLGSGLLLDVPLEDLSRHFRELFLVDMVHLPEVRRRAARLPSVHLLTADVTGVVAPLARLRPHVPIASLDAAFHAKPDTLPQVDWVASVNLLSQLPLLPLAWAERLLPALTEAQLLPWQDQLLTQHLLHLRTLAPSGCLLADRVQRSQEGGRAEEVMDYRPWLSSWGAPLRSWAWQLADARETGGVILEHQVGVWDW